MFRTSRQPHNTKQIKTMSKDKENIKSVVKRKRFTGIILKDGAYETEDVYNVGGDLFLNKCEIEQLKKSLENTQKLIK